MYLLFAPHGYRVHTKAVVRVTCPVGGMGLGFTETTEDKEASLALYSRC